MSFGSAALSHASQDSVGREFTFTDEDFSDIAEMLRLETGIALHSSKSPLVYSRLVRRLRHLRFRDFREYRSFLRTPEGADERKKMMVALTTNVTRFFREPHHFEHLRETALPPLIAAARAGRRVRLWSAGCSSGEEPYSIALCVLELFPEAARHDFRILATDFSTDMIEAGKRGVYEDANLDTVTREMKQKWFRPADATGASWQVGDDMQRLVAFRELNLMAQWPMRVQFDVVFCRNVTIYFDESTQTQVWSRLIDKMNDGAFIYIGHSERILEPAASRVRSEGTTIYSRLGGRR